MAKRGRGLGRHQRVVLAVVGAPLGMPHNHIAAAQFGQERPVAARLRCLTPATSAAVSRSFSPSTKGLHAAQVGDRRQYRHVDDVEVVEVFLWERERDLLHQRHRFERVEVHLPVAGDQRLATHGLLLLSGSTRRGRAASFLQGIPARPRHQWKCGRSHRRAARTGAPRPPSRRRPPR